jgi:tetratricopeptide (TPR) repeat protein
LLGDTNPIAIQCIILLANWYAENGRLEDAERRFARAVPALRKSKGYSDPATLEATQGLAIVCVGLRRYEEALTYFREVISIFDRIDHRNFGYFEILIRMGDALLGLRKYKEAEAVLLPAYSGMQEHVNELSGNLTKPVMGYAADVIVRFYRATGNKVEEEKWKAELRKHSNTNDPK